MNSVLRHFSPRHRPPVALADQYAVVQHFFFLYFRFQFNGWFHFPSICEIWFSAIEIHTTETASNIEIKGFLFIPLAKILLCDWGNVM